jgi:hypothetical protein
MVTPHHTVGYIVTNRKHETQFASNSLHPSHAPHVDVILAQYGIKKYQHPSQPTNLVLVSYAIPRASDTIDGADLITFIRVRLIGSKRVQKLDVPVDLVMHPRRDLMQCLDNSVWDNQEGCYNPHQRWRSHN